MFLSSFFFVIIVYFPHFLYQTCLWTIPYIHVIPLLTNPLRHDSVYYIFFKLLCRQKLYTIQMFFFIYSIFLSVSLAQIFKVAKRKKNCLCTLLASHTTPFPTLGRVSAYCATHVLLLNSIIKQQINNSLPSVLISKTSFEEV